MNWWDSKKTRFTGSPVNLVFFQLKFFSVKVHFVNTIDVLEWDVSPW